MSSDSPAHTTTTMGSRTRNLSECSEGEKESKTNRFDGSSYDIDGKFSYTTVSENYVFKGATKTAVDENGKFAYFSADMRPVPPGWYDVDKTKHKVPMGWYDHRNT